MIKSLLRLPLYCLAFFFLTLVLLIAFGVSDRPDNKLDWSMTPTDVSRAKKILREGSKTRPDTVGRIELSLADMNLVGNYLLNRFNKGKAVIALKDRKIRFAVTATLPDNRLGKYVNISFRLGHEGSNNLPTLTKFKAGKLLLPSKVAAFAIETIIQHTALNEYFLLATDPIQSVVIENDKVTITYHSSQATLANARDLLTYSDVPADRANIYRKKLTDIVSKHDPEWRLSLADLLKPLFALAWEKSNPEIAIEENRLVINTVNNYVNAKRTDEMTDIRYYPAYLYKRNDLAQHFIGAAAITASVNGQFAQVLGEEKELIDAKGGSGFSFVDLTADKAGTRFGEIAVASPASARRLQEAMAAIKDYTEFMPDPTALPEHMNEDEFKRRYGSIDSAAFKKLSQQIDAMIAETPIYKNR